MMRVSRARAVGLLVSALLLAVTGCSSTSKPLDGTKWMLAEWTISSIDPADVTITADFADGQVSGSSGVNSYSGPCEIGPGDAFSAGPLAGTLMAGPEPAMRAESAYLKLLDDAASYGVEGGTLTLYDKGGNESLIYRAKGE